MDIIEIQSPKNVFWMMYLIVSWDLLKQISVWSAKMDILSLTLNSVSQEWSIVRLN